MCGIAGIVSREHQSEVETRLASAARFLQHRGPDGEGMFVAPARDRHAAVGLLHRRLSIIDLSSAANQPMSLAERDDLRIVLNGEIYNYRELRSQLEDVGQRFKTSSDTEVLLAAYAQWGSECLRRLEGMFAFAIYDAKRQTLFLARDFFGIKPLFYWKQGDELHFASEIPALLAMGRASRRLDAARAFEHLNYWTTDQGEGTFFADIKKIPAAHYVEISLADPAQMSLIRYWDIDRSRRSELSFADAASRMRELFAESVQRHLRSDVPVTVALSGGTDSSSVVMNARRQKGSEAELHTISYIASVERLSEEPWIDSVNHAAKATSHKLKIQDHELGDEFEKFVALQAQPTVTPVVYAQNRVFRHAHELGFKVILEGQGADELLAGYPFYQQARMATLLGKLQIVTAIRFLQRAPAQFRVNAGWIFRNAVRRAMPTAVVRAWRSRKDAHVMPWINRRWADKHQVLDNAAPLDVLSDRSGDYLRDMIYDAVFSTKLPGLLRYGDHNAMAVSVENRVPFLTPKIAEFVFSLPEEYIISPSGESKAVFREAMRGITPEFVLRRKNKIGFEPPYTDWMNGMRPKLARKLREGKELKALNPDVLEAQAHEVEANPIPNDSVANRLWRIACFVQWAQQFQVQAD